MKKVLTLIATLSISFSLAGQANANICSQAASLQSNVNKVENALASKGVTGMTTALKQLGIPVTEAMKKSGKKALVVAMNYELGSLKTSLTAANTACKAYNVFHSGTHAVCGYWHGSQKVKDVWHGHWACRMQPN
jgi:hypothetical protein